jgi:hypothetical protein
MMMVGTEEPLQCIRDFLCKQKTEEVITSTTSCGTGSLKG